MKKEYARCISALRSPGILTLLPEGEGREAYQGETGKTLEDFITEILSRLETDNGVSYDVRDSHALWSFGQYMKISYAEVVPTGRWHRDVGRVRLDMHRRETSFARRALGFLRW